MIPKEKNMKYLISIILIFAFCLPLLAQDAMQDITGKWYTSNKESIIQIYKTASGSYQGKIVWLKNANDEGAKPKTDSKNPDKKLRNRPLMNLVVLSNLAQNKKNNYDGGKIYDPQSGKTYSCKAELSDANTLKLRGFIGVSLIGRTETWTRTK